MDKRDFIIIDKISDTDYGDYRHSGPLKREKKRTIRIMKN